MMFICKHFIMDFFFVAKDQRKNVSLLGDEFEDVFIYNSKTCYNLSWKSYIDRHVYLCFVTFSFDHVEKELL